MNLVCRVDTLDAADTQDLPSKVLDHYNDAFHCINDVLYHINTNQSCQPNIHPPHHVPNKLRPKIQKQLLHMETSMR